MTAAAKLVRIGIRQLTQQSWLSRGFRRRLIDRLTPATSEAFEISVFGALIYVGRFDSYIDRDVYFFGAYEPEVLAVLRQLARHRNGVLLDVGANVGHHTLFASQHYAQVHAFEPYPPLVDVLQAQVARNHLAQVHVHALGLANIDGEAEYGAPADERAGYGGFDNHDPNLRKVRLPIRCGDRYLPTVGVAQVDVIKIDVEGSERQVIEGLQEILTTHRPALVVEYWPENWPKPIGETLPPRYHLWWLRHGGSRWGLFNSDRPRLLPVDRAPAGAMILALPSEWPFALGTE